LGKGLHEAHLALGNYQAALEDLQEDLQLRPEASDRQAIEEKIGWLQGQIG
jgi:regulator of sirC expression with transglutaminase-like and TPR domain